MRGFLLVAFLLCSGVAYAQNPEFPPPPSDPNKRAEMAEDYFNQAEALYRVQEYDKAFLYYKQSYLLSQQPALLFNMGQCQRQLGRHEEALKSYKSFVRDDPDNKLRPQVEKLILEEEKAIADAKLNKPPEDPKLKLDTDGDKIVDANDLCVNDAEDGKGDAPNDGCPLKKGPDTDPDTKPTLDPMAKNLFFGAAGAGAAGLGVGIFAFSQSQKAKSAQGPEAPDQDAADTAFGRAKTFALVSDVLLIAAAGTGAVGFLLQQKSKKQPEVKVSVLPNGASVSVRF
jgi:tetratricopeptide (TPR) repeat protein